MSIISGSRGAPSDPPQIRPAKMFPFQNEILDTPLDGPAYYIAGILQLDIPPWGYTVLLSLLFKSFQPTKLYHNNSI